MLKSVSLERPQIAAAKPRAHVRRGTTVRVRAVAEADVVKERPKVCEIEFIEVDAVL